MPVVKCQVTGGRSEAGGLGFSIFNGMFDIFINLSTCTICCTVWGWVWVFATRIV